MPNKSYYKRGTVEFCIAEYLYDETDGDADPEETLNAKLSELEHSDLVEFIEEAASKGWLNDHI